VITLLLPLLLASDPVVPIAGRPVDFSGAVGGPFVVTIKVDKTEVRLEEPVTLTITITGPGDLSKVKRPNLKDDPEWNSGFVIDDATSQQTPNPSSVVWEFTLRPRAVGFHTLPRIRFTYFNPAIVSKAMGWQTTYSNETDVSVNSNEISPHPNAIELIEWAKQTSKTYDLEPSLGLRIKYWWLGLQGSKVAYRDRLFYSAASVEDGDYPHATWILLRHLVVEPGDRHFRTGLRLLRSTVNYPTNDYAERLLRPETEWWPYWLYHPGFTIAAIVAALCIIARFVRAKHCQSIWYRLMLGVFILVLLIPVIGETVRYSRAARWESAPQCVIRTETDLREGNGTTYAVKLHLPAGVEARLIGSRSDWMQIEFASGLVGWVHKKSLICDR